MKIFKSDPPEIICAKKAAMISMYAIHNPLHVFFEDGNVHRGPMNFERSVNDECRDKNGELMYEFVRQFLNEFEELPVDMRWPVYRLYRQRYDYLSRKWRKKIRANSTDPMGCGSLWYRRSLEEDGHIYVITNIGIKLMQF
jgi:hypothetical protein